MIYAKVHNYSIGNTQNTTITTSSLPKPEEGFTPYNVISVSQLYLINPTTIGIKPAATVEAEQLAKQIPGVISSIQLKAQSTILSGFTSSALGAVYKYPSTTQDQGNLKACILHAGSSLMLSLPWSPGTNYAAGTLVEYNKLLFEAQTTGISGTTQPDWLAAITTNPYNAITDNAVTWKQWSVQFWCADTSNIWKRRPHTAAQINQVSIDGFRYIDSMLSLSENYVAQAQSATSLAALNAVNWPIS